MRYTHVLISNCINLSFVKYFLDYKKSGLITIVINLILQQSILIIFISPRWFFAFKKNL